MSLYDSTENPAMNNVRKVDIDSHMQMECLTIMQSIELFLVEVSEGKKNSNVEKAVEIVFLLTLLTCTRISCSVLVVKTFVTGHSKNICCIM